MKIGIPKERRPHESRVSASPETVAKLIKNGSEVLIESGAGDKAGFSDDVYMAVGARIVEKTADVFAADVLFKVQPPLLKGEGDIDEVALLRKDQVLISLLNPLVMKDHMTAYQKAGVTSVALESVPRISRAQAMDVLSSQSNLAGYRAVLEAAHEFGRAFPMMMTAAGTIFPAKILVIGAGVAGLQAIATARRLGGVVSAFDVRPVAKEQVESLGATFIQVAADNTDAETSGGYAKEMDDAYKQKQTDLMHETIKTVDIVITTALIPGKPAPKLISKEMVKDMKPGSVIVDLAVEAGGNCALSKLGEVVVHHGVKIVGYPNLPGRLATDASLLFARNIYNLFDLLVDNDTGILNFNFSDEIIAGATWTHEGVLRHGVSSDKISKKDITPEKGAMS